MVMLPNFMMKKVVLWDWPYIWVMGNIAPFLIRAIIDNTRGTKSTNVEISILNVLIDPAMQNPEQANAKKGGIHVSQGFYQAVSQRRSRDGGVHTFKKTPVQSHEP